MTESDESGTKRAVRQNHERTLKTLTPSRFWTEIFLAQLANLAHARPLRGRGGIFGGSLRGVVVQPVITLSTKGGRQDADTPRRNTGSEPERPGDEDGSKTGGKGYAR